MKSKSIFKLSLLLIFLMGSKRRVDNRNDNRTQSDPAPVGEHCSTSKTVEDYRSQKSGIQEIVKPKLGCASVQDQEAAIKRQNLEGQNPLSAKAQEIRKEQKRIADKLDADSSESDDDSKIIKLPNGDRVVPFCKLCNNPKAKSMKRAVHHALCPENDCFYDSNADEILQNIVDGVAHGCLACVDAYRLGKAPKKNAAHHIRCPSRKSAKPAGKRTKKAMGAKKQGATAAPQSHQDKPPSAKRSKKATKSTKSNTSFLGAATRLSPI